MNNQAWLQRSLQAVWHPCTQMKRHETFPLVPVARAQGAWLYDFDGKRYLDGVSSWWVNLFGHGHPAINAALKDQLDQLEHVMLAGFTHAPVIELSERLSALTGGVLGHAFYGSDGASATEMALKKSFHYWRNVGQPEKTRFLHLTDSYHGETLGALAVTDVALFRDTYAPLLRAGVAMPSPDRRLASPGEAPETVAARAIRAMADYLALHHSQVAAVIVEPLVQGAAGMAMYGPWYLQQLRRLCDQYQVHLIADEIAVGCGRTGTFFACEQAGIWPDLLLLSKGITGGYLPLSVVLSRDTIYQAFYHDDVSRGFLHSHSYTGNPLACRAALATLSLFEQQDVFAQNRLLAARINHLAEPIRALPFVRQFRQAGETGGGMIWAFEVEDAPTGFAQLLFAAALKRELLLRPMGPTVYWMPPYVLTDEEAEHLVAATHDALLEVMGAPCGVRMKTV
ncbi:adenosylmethionine--8-amino-7-oxononanoate transaminase [Leeia sp.]|uniref:adenosylmethionine--8-amino-7-oxononanoate transaminase n=1 Tax=Leeia sp. TaxID=2884678 RepID=UPI0035B422B0